MTRENKEIKTREKEEINKEAGEPTHAGVFYTPAVDIFETQDALTLVADLPGVDKNNLVVDVKENVLTVSGKVSEVQDRLRPKYREYGIGGYTRSFTLGDKIDQTKINALLKDGVLTLTLPKAEPMRPRKIEIHTN